MKASKIFITVAASSVIAACGSSDSGGGPFTGVNGIDAAGIGSNSNNNKFIAQTTSRLMTTVLIDKIEAFAGFVYVDEDLQTGNTVMQYMCANSGTMDVTWTSADNEINTGDDIDVVFNACDDDRNFGAINGTLSIHNMIVNSGTTSYRERGDIMMDVTSVGGVAAHTEYDGKYDVTVNSSGQLTCKYRGDHKYTPNSSSPNDYEELIDFNGEIETNINTQDLVVEAGFKMVLQSTTGPVAFKVNTVTPFDIPSSTGYPVAGRVLIEGANNKELDVHTQNNPADEAEITYPFGSTTLSTDDPWSNYF